MKYDDLKNGKPGIYRVTRWGNENHFVEVDTQRPVISERTSTSWRGRSNVQRFLEARPISLQDEIYEGDNEEPTKYDPPTVYSQPDPTRTPLRDVVGYVGTREEWHALVLEERAKSAAHNAARRAARAAQEETVNEALNALAAIGVQGQRRAGGDIQVDAAELLASLRKLVPLTEAQAAVEREGKLTK